jgi:hypothetical protein
VENIPVFLKVRIVTPTIPLLGIDPKEFQTESQASMHVRMFLTAKKWNNVQKLMDGKAKVLYSYMEHDSVIKETH